MKKRILLLLSLIFSITAIAAAQTRTVTNAELEKFRQKRLAAEKDYRETYAERGLPSPQELEKQVADDKQRWAERWAQIEKEKFDLDRYAQPQMQILLVNPTSEYLVPPTYSNSAGSNFYVSTPYFNSGGYYNWRRYRSNNTRRSNYWRNNTLPPIRPPKPIRPPRIYGDRR